MGQGPSYTWIPALDRRVSGVTILRGNDRRGPAFLRGSASEFDHARAETVEGKGVSGLPAGQEVGLVLGDLHGFGFLRVVDEEEESLVQALAEGGIYAGRRR